VTEDDIVTAAIEAENMFGASCFTPQSAPTIRRLAALDPATLAIMHGASYRGEAREALFALADDFDHRLAQVS
jgi:hypothetical protein